MNEAQITIPHLFRCPISLDLFEDPVTLCTGQTYERSSIEKWLSAGNFTCPVTMQKLHDLTIVPNHTLRHLIDQWLQLGPQFDPSGNGNSATSTIDSLSALKQSLESKEATLENKLQALEKIMVLSDEYCSFRKSCFLQLGFLPLLLELVFGRENHMGFTELALSCIVKLLPLSDSEPLNMIKEESKLATFLLLFEKATSSVKINLCHIIDSTAASETEELCSMLGNSHELVREIVQLVLQSCEASISKAAIKAMSALCSLKSNRESLVRAGAIDGIITYISGCEITRHKKLAPLGMKILEKLLVVESGKEALVNHPNGIQTLVKMVFSFSRACDEEECCSESAVGLLSIVCGGFESAREEAIGVGVLTQLLFLLQSQCGNRTKTKARMLLKLLGSKWTGTEEPKHKAGVD